jgi:hypothetical protein
MEVDEVAGHRSPILRAFAAARKAASRALTIARSSALLFALSAALRGAEAEGVGATAVWSPPTGFLDSVHRSCDALSGEAFGSCFVARLRDAGASEAAVAFARRTGNLGYLRKFRYDGIVSVAWAELPFRANENAACFLVNGLPPMIDVDDLSLLSRDTLDQNGSWAAIAKAYPKVAIFPGDRFGDGAVRPGPRPGGGQRFAVEYTLVDGCHACARVGVLRLGFDFDGEGKYLGLSVLSVTPQPR